MNKIGAIKYTSLDYEMLRKLNYSRETATPVYKLNSVVSPGVFNKYTSSFPEEKYSNLGSDSAKNMPVTNNITQTKGNTTVNIYGNVDKENIDEITETINSDNFFKEMLSMENIFNNTQQLFKGK